MKTIRSQFDSDAEDYEEVLPENEDEAMAYVMNKIGAAKQEKASMKHIEQAAIKRVESAAFTYDELRKAGRTKIKHKGLKGSNTPKESQDFVQGLGDAVDSGPDGGNVPSGGGYGDGGGVGASIMARLVTAKKLSGTDKDWWEGLDKKQQEAYIEKHPNSKYAKHAAKQSKKKGAGLFPKWSDFMTGKKDNDKKDRKKQDKAFRKVDKMFKDGPSFASTVEASIAARIEQAERDRGAK